MSSQLSHRSIAEIRTFVSRSESASLPNTDWNAAKRCAVSASVDPNPAEYFSSSGGISLGKLTLTEALDVVFSAGKPVTIGCQAPDGFFEGILQRYRTECKESLTMREITFNEDQNITDILINAYYTSFPCRHCSGYGDSEGKYEVFHITSPDAPRCLSLKLPWHPWKPVTLVSCRYDCHSTSKTVKQSQRKKSLLRLAELRREAMRFLLRVELDTCLLVNRLWSSDVHVMDKSSKDLALRKLEQVLFKYDTLSFKSPVMYFKVSSVEAERSPDRTFMLPRNADVDSAIVANHLRNCATTTDGLEFEVGQDDDECGLELNDSVHSWISKLLSNLLNPEINFCFTKLRLRLGLVNAADAVNFMSLTSLALSSSTKDDELRTVSLQVNDEALGHLAEQHFLQWPYLQSTEDIRLRIMLFETHPPGDLSWIRGLFQLPNCKTMVVRYNTLNIHDVYDCSGHVFLVLREIVEHWENATDVSGFPESFEIVLEQMDLTWTHREPTPTYSSVPMPHHDGLWNVYVTKNEATDVPLSVYVNTKETENCAELAREYAITRRFIFRKESYNPELVKTSRPRKRCLQ